MRALVILLALLLVSCGRPLTQEEAAFAARLHGGAVDTSRIRVIDGALVGSVTHKRRKRPRLACRERILPEPRGETVTVAPAAVVLHNRMFFARDWYAGNYLPDYPDRMSLMHAMVFAHELTHVWQWQNRAATRYSPLRAIGEHRRADDPYLFDIGTENDLLDYGYEQQAGIVEEYVCCATLDPAAPRTARLGAMLRRAFPLQELPHPENVILPWDGAETRGICR